MGKTFFCIHWESFSQQVLEQHKDVFQKAQIDQFMTLMFCPPYINFKKSRILVICPWDKPPSDWPTIQPLLKSYILSYKRRHQSGIILMATHFSAYAFIINLWVFAWVCWTVARMKTTVCTANIIYFMEIWLLSCILHCVIYFKHWQMSNVSFTELHWAHNQCG